MVLASEETVTKMLTEKEIVNPNKVSKPWASNPRYNLGNYLKGVKSEPRPWGDKYIFIK